MRLSSVVAAAACPSSGRLPGIWRCVAIGFWAAIAAGALDGVPSVFGQGAPPTFPPALMGFDIPPGPLRHGAGERFTVRDENGRYLVARLVVEVGQHRVVMLPDGRLTTRSVSETTATDEPFKPTSKEELVQQLLADPRFRTFKTKTSRHFVFVYNTSDEFSLVTTRILERMVPGVMAYMETNKLKVTEPEVPLTVLMFRTEDEFQSYQRMPSGVVAYYTPATNHVVLYEESPLLRVRRELAIQQTISTIAHEGAHQILHNIGVQQRLSRWPMWLSEGIAEYFAPTSTGKNLTWKGVGQVNDMRMFELEQYLKARDAEGADGQMVDYSVMAARLTSTGYASAWSLTHFLAKTQRTEFHKYLSEVSKLRAFEGEFDPRSQGLYVNNKKAFARYFGDDSKAIERKLIAYLKKLPYNAPFAEYPHYVALVSFTLGGRTKRDANLFLSQELAEKWRAETLEKLADEQRTGVQSTVRLLANRAAAEAYAKQWMQSK